MHTSHTPRSVVSARCLLVLTTGLALAAPATAQVVSSSLPRGDTKLNANYSPVGSQGFGAWRIATPKQLLAGASPTAKVAYAVYMDLDAAQATQLHVRRSSDGGLTWESAKVVFTVGATDRLQADWTSILAWENQVFVVYVTGAQGATIGPRSVWCVGSADQGQTWTAPFLVSKLVQAPTNPSVDCEEPACAVSRGRLHVAFRADSQLSPNEDLWYAGVELVGGSLVGTVPESRVATAQAQGSVDVDLHSIAADDNVVHVAWLDDRDNLGNDNQNNCFSKTSTGNGGDFATVAEVRHTSYTTPLTWAPPRRPLAAAAKPNVYVSLEDSRTGVDQIWLRYSSNLGVQWDEAKASQTPGTVDIDGQQIVASGNRVVITYRDDRNGTGNNINNVFAVTDQNAGLSFKAGPVAESRLSTPNCDSQRGLVMVGDLIVCAWEQCAGPEEWALAYSVDGGVSWKPSIQVTRLGSCTQVKPRSADVDDPAIDVTLNGDVIGIWIDDRDNSSGGNTTNNTYVTGVKLPELRSNLATSQGLRLVHAHKGEAGYVAVVLVSMTGQQPPIVLSPFGLSINLAYDLLTATALGIPSLFVTTVDANGEAAFPAIPNLTTLLGVPVHAAALTIDVAGSRFVSFTDPIRL